MNELTQTQRFAVVFVLAALYVLFDNIKRLDRQNDEIVRAHNSLAIKVLYPEGAP